MTPAELWSSYPDLVGLSAVFVFRVATVLLCVAWGVHWIRSVSR